MQARQPALRPFSLPCAPAKSFLFVVTLLLFLGPLSSHLYAAVNVQLSHSLPSPQPVGTTVVWASAATDPNPGSISYRFSVKPPAGDFVIIRDFTLQPGVEWTPGEREGAYQIKVTARNNITHETGDLTVNYVITSRVTGGIPVISNTAHPLVALYSAPPCSEGSMRVRFWRTGDTSSQTTPWKSCQPDTSMNFYIAGMLAATQYSMQHEISSRAALPAEIGPTLFYTTATPPIGMFPNNSVLVPSAASEQGVLLNTNLVGGFFLTATDLSGQGLWYYHKSVRYGTRPIPGGTMLVILDVAGTYNTLREIDLAGNTLRETNVTRVSEQLVARGEQPITSFHHEARRLPDGKTLVLCSNDRTLSDVQGPGPVAIVGDEIVVLDQNWQVVWSWNAFDHLDVTRKALLDEKCTVTSCPPNMPPNSNDWLHSNSVSYVNTDGNLLMSMRHQDWLIKIDYSDGSGTGAVLWRLGKDGDFTTDSNDSYPWFSHQHDAEFELGGGQTISLFDNGNLRRAVPGVNQNSRGQVWNIDETNHTASLQLNADLGDYSFALGSAQRLADGSYHFLAGWLPNEHSQSIEAQPDGSISFRFDNQVTAYRSFRMRDLYTPASFGLTDKEDDQSISFDPVSDKTFGDAPFAVSATASSSLPVNFRIMSGPANVSSNMITITGAGTVVLQAEQGGNANYNSAASVSQAFNVNKAQATITLSNLSQMYDGTARSVTATTDPAGLSGLSITYDGSTAEPVNAGSYQVVASLNNGNYHAVDATGTLVVSKAQASIKLSNLNQTYDGTGRNVLATTDPAGLSGVSITYDGSTSEPVNVGSYQVVASLNNGNYQAADATGTLVVSKADQSLSFEPLSDKTYGDAPFNINASSTSGLPVHFSILSGPATMSDDILTITGAGTVTVRASQAGDTNYQAAPDVDQSFTVGKATPAITWTNPASITYGTALDATQLNAASSVPGALVYTPVAGTILNAGNNQSLTVNFNPADSANYKQASLSVSINVSKADQIINFGALPGKTYGDAPFMISATTPSGLPVNFQVLSGPASINGNTVTINGAGTVTLRAAQEGNDNYNAAANADQSFTVAPASTSVVVTSSVNPSDLEQEVVFKAVVQNVSTNIGPPTGTVIFTVDGLAQPPVTLSNGTAQLSTSTLSTNQHTIGASYNGDGNFSASTNALADGQVVKAQPALSINDISFTEGDGGTNNATFTVTLSAASSLPVSVNYQTSDGTAQAGPDYQNIPGSVLNFNSGETIKSITVAVNGNTLNEADETFFVNLSNAVHASLTKAQGVGTILNDDTPSVQFSSQTYSFSEGAGSAQITVTRSGDASQAATIEYRISDGTASHRTDYTITSGLLGFAAGETSKTLSILLTNNAYPDGSRTVNLNLSNPHGAGATLGALNTALLIITDDDTAQPTTNPVDDAQFFVRQLYADFLNRAPDNGGLDYWTNEISKCGSDAQCIHDRRVGVADAFFFEPEFQHTGAFIYRLYKAALGPNPTYAQFVSYRGLVVAGPDLEQSKTDFTRSFVQNAAFLEEYPQTLTKEQFVDRMLLVVKNYSHLDLSAQRNALLDLYDGTDNGRAAILKYVAESQTFVDAEYNNSFVLMEYFGYLRRDPEPEGFAFWLSKVNQFPLRDAGIQHAMACSFITSAEYQTRFSSVLTSSNRLCPSR
jgi:arylsulfate sulfotransferase